MHVYVTMLRDPLERMMSWFAYCNKYSPNKCNAGKDFKNKGAPGESVASRFYTARRKLYDTTKTPSGPPQGTFHPNHLEYTLDDNYHTRMICGPPAHDHPIPIRPEHTACALQNLDREYLFVGITERYQESLCVMADMLGIKNTAFKNDKATTGSKKSSMPEDFLTKWKPYAASDELLYEYANARLDESLLSRSKCQTSTRIVESDVQYRLNKFGAYLQ